MQDFPLTIGSILRHGSTVHPTAEVVTATTEGTRSETFADLGRRAAQLAHGLRSLGITGDQRVATFQWNNAEHLEVYLAAPAMGAVLHTLNIRLFPEQLVYVANHAEDKVLVVDDSLVPLLAPQLSQMSSVTHVLVAGPDAAAADLDSLRATGKGAAMTTCSRPSPPSSAGPTTWTSATPRHVLHERHHSSKGVVYSHRSAWLHSAAVMSGNVSSLSFTDRCSRSCRCSTNAWGLPYAALMTAPRCTYGRWLQALLVRFMREVRPTLSGAYRRCGTTCCTTPTAPEEKVDSLRLVLCGGSAVRVTPAGAGGRHGIVLRQAWG